MTLKLHRPDGEGGLEPRPVPEENWRSQLRSPRWGTGLRARRLPALRNSEMNPPNPGRPSEPMAVKIRMPPYTGTRGNRPPYSFRLRVCSRS